MLTIRYDPYKGECFPDACTESAVGSLIHDYYQKGGHGSECNYITGSELFLNYIRVAVRKEVIPHSEVRVLFFEEVIRIDKFGCLERFPEGFCIHWEDSLKELLDWSKYGQ